MKFLILPVFFISLFLKALPQVTPIADVPESYKIGYRNIVVTDSNRSYKPNSGTGNLLKFRPVEIDLWYPAANSGNNPAIQYGYFLEQLQQRSNRFQDDTVYRQMTNELVNYLSANLEIKDLSGLIHLPTESYLNVIPIKQKFPLIIYLCSYNGMSYENVALFESLAERGYLVASITSVGRYPGNMSEQLPDLMEQVADAEFAIHYLKTDNTIDTGKIGAVGYSWGGPAALILSMNNSAVKVLLSLDGSELHYYGDDKKEDNDFDQIIRSSHFNGKKLNIPYAYLESGFKQAHADADSIFNIFDLTVSEKMYARFPKSTHEDFSFLPSLPQKVYGKTFADQHVNIPYKEFALCLFDGYLKGGKNETSSFLDSLYRHKIADSGYPVLISRKNLVLIRGTIADEKNGESLGYVNVGIRNKNIGTVSAKNGKFQLKIDSTLKTDSLTFSMAGYLTSVVPVGDLLGNSKPHRISLKEKVSDLKEVVITSKALKTEVRGNTTTSNFISVGLPLKFLGSETGIRLHLGKKPVFLKSFSFNISDNRLDTAVFRLNIYNMRNGEPFENILHRNILIPVGKQTGKYTLNLNDYKLVLNGDVLLSLEWIEGSSSGRGHGVIFLSAGFLNSATWHRLTSQAAWKKATGLGVGFNVLIQTPR